MYVLCVYLQELEDARDDDAFAACLHGHIATLADILQKEEQKEEQKDQRIVNVLYPHSQQTLLHLAARRGDAAVVGFLLERVVNINALDKVSDADAVFIVCST